VQRFHEVLFLDGQTILLVVQMHQVAQVVLTGIMLVENANMFVILLVEVLLVVDMMIHHVQQMHQAVQVVQIYIIQEKNVKQFVIQLAGITTMTQKF
jgi:hypothetical protein